MMRQALFRRFLLVLSNLLLPGAVLIFASGFFPYKPFLPGLASFDVEQEHNQPEAPFDKVIFMVVDALRSDFVYGHGTGFRYTQSLIRDGAAIPFTAHATPPTVTMPRVKALTTGSVPSFLDLILNFAESDTSSSLATQDTWLAQLRARPHGKLVLYGDDTWLKLFPGSFFARSDGTSSFFVSDFTQVDHNVTRHIPRELQNSDWNAMIMHYLGMDHIGHKTGPQGPNMIPKQEEMDGIVEMIYDALVSEEHHQRTLLVLAGDHGMNAGGNHGGSGPGETEPALLFVSPKLQQFTKTRKYECPTMPKTNTEFHFYTKMEQSDVVPTLAVLMGFPIPTNSLGVCMPEVLGHWQKSDQVILLEHNAAQLLRIIRIAYGEQGFDEMTASYSTSTSCFAAASIEQDLACKLALSRTLADPDAKITALYDFLYAAQEAMSSTASSYNIPRMVFGIVIASVSAVLALSSIRSLWPPSLGAFFMTILVILYAIMMFASSYVEEEQHFWYWLTPAWFAVLTVRAIQNHDYKDRGQLSRIITSSILLLALHRLSVRWNQTGQKHAGEPDIVHAFFPEHHILMWMLILSVYVFIGYQMTTTTFEGLLHTELAAPLALALIIPAIIFKLNFTQADAPELVQGLAQKLRDWSEPLSLVLQARLVFALLASTAVAVVLFSVSQKKISKHGSITLAARLQSLLALFFATQTRAPNVPLLLVLDIQANLLQAITATSSLTTKPIDVALSVLLLSHTTYYCFGGSNSISSLDLSNAYNGVADYNIAAVGILLFASNWTGPLWWAVTAVTRLLPETPVRPGRIVGGRAWIEQERTKLHEEAVASVQRSRDTKAAVQEVWLSYMAVLTAFFAASLVAVMAACTALRVHLFIWTVFSPKYLYAMAWSVGWHLIVNGVVGGALWLLFISA